MIIDKALVKRILVITLSNVGDIILTTPVVRTLVKEFPGSRIDVMVGPAGKEIFEKDPAVFKVIIYDKHLPIAKKRRLQLKLKKLNYDFIVDLRNTIFPLLLGPRFRTGTLQNFPKEIIHRKDRHLYRLEPFGMADSNERTFIHIPDEDEAHVARLLEAEGVAGPMVVVSPGAKSHLKRWTEEGFASVSERLSDACGAAIVFVGSGDDEAIVRKIMERMSRKASNLVNKTTIRQLAAVLKRATLVITNDSAPLHLSCAVGAKVLAIFGPTDPKKYGPTGEYDTVIAKKLHCSPCEKAACAYHYECMTLISADEVFAAARMMVEGYE